jgi:hypothetical protein
LPFANGFLAGTRELDNEGDGWGIKWRTSTGAWRTLATADGGLPGNRITALAATGSGNRLWVGTAGRGVAVWDGGRWRGYRAFGRAKEIAAVNRSADAGADSLTLSLDPDALGAALPGPVQRLRLDGDPTLYELTQARAVEGGTAATVSPRLLVPVAAGTKVYSVERGAASDTGAALAVDQSGITWVGGRRTVWLGRCPTYPRCWLDGGLTAMDGSGWRAPAELPEGQVLADVQALAAMPGGEVWVGTASANQGLSVALARYRPSAGAWTVFRAEGGLGLGAVTGFAAEQEAGAMWVAHHSAAGCDPAVVATCSPKRVGGGLARWDGATWHTWTKAQGAPLLAYGDEGDITALLRDSERGLLYAGAWSADPSGFHWNSGVGIRTALSTCRGDCSDGWESIDFGADGPVRALALDSARRLWVGSSRDRLGAIPPDAGLRVLTDTGWIAVSAARAPLPDDNVTALASDGSAMWVGSYDRGLAVWRPFEPTAYAYLPMVARQATR